MLVIQVGNDLGFALEALAQVGLANWVRIEL
jgi:hypothetical protein